MRYGETKSQEKVRKILWVLLRKRMFGYHPEENKIKSQNIDLNKENNK